MGIVFKRAGRFALLQPKNLDALRSWRVSVLLGADGWFPWNFAFYTQGYCEGMRPSPGCIVWRMLELINGESIPINAYSEAFLCHMGISRNYFQRPEEVPTFIGEDGREMDLFSMVHLSKPKQVTEGVRPLRDGEEPLLESTAGRTMELVLEQPEVESTDVLAPTPHARVQVITWSPHARRKALTLLKLLMSQKGFWLKAGGLPVVNEWAHQEGASSQSSPHPRPVPRLEGMPVDQLMEEFDMVTAQQAALLADAQAEAESSRSYAQKLAEEKMALLVKNNHFAGLDEFRQRVEELLEKQEEKLRKLSIEYDEELYPHMLSAIAERRWLISHGLRLAAMSALESQEVKQSFGDVVKCALARGKAEAVEELHEKKLLTVPAAQDKAQVQATRVVATALKALK
ncbi:hypothetical protein Tco_0098985 [Tanacetum coccineum]